MIISFDATLLASIAFAVSFCGCGATLWLCRRFGWGADSTISVQRLHRGFVPRLGGVPIGAAFTISILSASLLYPEPWTHSLFLLLAVMLPTFIVGVTEDLTQRVGTRVRLLVTMLSAALGIGLLGALLNRINIPGVDTFLASHWAAAVILTLIAGAGVPHAINIVDGCNGLSSSVGITVFIGLGILSWQLGDTFIATTALIAACATFGFTLWNFPLGKIFLGDGGAYSMGVLIAELSILLIVRHPQVSAWFALLLVIHPVWEVLFSCARRGRHSLRRMFEPDVRHLHQLVYRRVFEHAFEKGSPYSQAYASAMAAATFTAWHATMLLLALLFWNNSAALIACILGFIVLYGVSYRLLMQHRSFITHGITKAVQRHHVMHAKHMMQNVLTVPDKQQPVGTDRDT
ncbi:MAG: glycosyl transferase [Nevskiaceae bacterium]|nr:MAG: glycosyl transferase [Nevskiaceae bacterium]TBR73902.1 MAG: glycosyl transferase [Nevskiaceae bacterium]